MLAIVGGSGLTKLAALQSPRQAELQATGGTPAQAVVVATAQNTANTTANTNAITTAQITANTSYGEPSATPRVGIFAGQKIVFLPRHGDGHALAPHEINYRANIEALRQLGVTAVIAVAAVGGIRSDLRPGALVIPHQILDYTHGRAASFSTPGKVVHIDFTHPYTQSLRARLLDAARAAGEAVADGGVYACTQGPRLETAAEIDRLERDGADIVGMTGMPEAALAREAGMAYATIAVVVNAAAGRGDSADKIEFDQLGAILDRGIARALRVLERAVQP